LIIDDARLSRGDITRAAPLRRDDETVNGDEEDGDDDGDDNGGGWSMLLDV
jgi:hypothetical protein